LNKQRNAFDYFYSQIESYNKPLSIIYNTDDTIIVHNVDSIPSGQNMSWYSNLISEIYIQYNIDSIIEKYSADNISFLITTNEIGKSYASLTLTDDSSNEFAVIFDSRGDLDGIGDRAGSFTYAHEILHLFGAIDLYTFTDERLELAENYFPEDLMLKHQLAAYYSTISNLDAYLIGWTDFLDKEEYGVFLTSNPQLES